MILFPVIENEPIVQENDKTRLDARKSFGSGTGSITKVEIKPARTEAFVDVTSDKYLDWAYAFELEVDATNNKIHFKEGAGGELIATLASASYSLEALCTEIETKLNAVGILNYTVALSDENEITISADGEFSLLVDTASAPAVSVLPHVGFTADALSVETKTGSKVETIEKTITVKLTDDSVVPLTEERESSVSVISELADALYSTDQKLRTKESEILNFVAEGRASFKDIHRRVQTSIIDWINKNGWVDAFGEKISKTHLIDHSELTEWATYMALRLIYEDNQDAENDIFEVKAKRYKGEEVDARTRLILRLDLNKDGQIDLGEQVSTFSSAFVVRR